MTRASARAVSSCGGSAPSSTRYRSGAAAVVAGVAGAAVLWLLGGYTWGFAWDSIGSALLSCAAVGLVMAAVFVVMLRSLKVREFDDFIQPLARRSPALGRLSR